MIPSIQRAFSRSRSAPAARALGSRSGTLRRRNGITYYRHFSAATQMSELLSSISETRHKQLQQLQTVPDVLDLSIAMAGNKLDLPSIRDVPQERVTQFATSSTSRLPRPPQDKRSPNAVAGCESVSRSPFEKQPNNSVTISARALDPGNLQNGWKVGQKECV
jgi:hypothetical protein